MREIVNIQVGQCGNQMASDFWEIMCDEYGLDHQGKLIPHYSHECGRLEVFFQEVPSHHRYVPRTVLIDMEPGTLDSIRSGKLGRLFSPDHYLFAQGGAGNNWAKGYYTDGAELVDGALDIIRKQTEACDCLQGFQMLHSLGGGSGSGLGTLLMSKLREEYPDRLMCTFSVIPSPKVSDSVVEPYNTTLALNQLIENADISFSFDNEALYDICVNTLKHAVPRFRDLNFLIATAMNGITSNLRYPGQLNCDYRKLAVNLVPFPRLHFLMISHGPLLPPEQLPYRSTRDMHTLTRELFHPRHIMCAIQPEGGRYLTCAMCVRGRVVSNWDIDWEMLSYTTKHSASFVPWIPDHVQVSLCTVPPVHAALSATMIANHTGIHQIWQRISHQFRAMLRRKAFLHWYTAEGMDEHEFLEADSNLEDLIAEYQQYQEMGVDGEVESEREGVEGSSLGDSELGLSPPLPQHPLIQHKGLSHSQAAVHHKTKVPTRSASLLKSHHTPPAHDYFTSMTSGKPRTNVPSPVSRTHPSHPFQHKPTLSTTSLETLTPIWALSSKSQDTLDSREGQDGNAFSSPQSLASHRVMLMKERGKGDKNKSHSSHARPPHAAAKDGDEFDDWEYHEKTPASSPSPPPPPPST